MEVIIRSEGNDENIGVKRLREGYTTVIYVGNDCWNKHEGASLSYRGLDTYLISVKFEFSKLYIVSYQTSIPTSALD